MHFLSFSWFSDTWNATYPCSSVFFSPMSLGQEGQRFHCK
jgi:hypothetical protein